VEVVPNLEVEGGGGENVPGREWEFDCDRGANFRLVEEEEEVVCGWWP